MQVTWRQMLTEEVERRGDPIGSLVTTLSDHELDAPFDDGYGGSEGKPFTAWTDRYVYFPAVYDGSEWVSSAPRNPCDEATPHVGGE